jgi:SecD/SecF fusion protein
MNRTLLWCSLLFVAFVVAMPAIQLITDDAPMSEALGKFFRLGPDLAGGNRLVYGVDRGRGGVDLDQVILVLKKRIDPTGTKNYIIRPVGGNRVEIIMASAKSREVSAREVNTAKSLVNRSGFLTFRICANPSDQNQAPKYREIVENRLKGIDPPPEYEWVQLLWNSRTEWERVSEFLFSRGAVVSREEALKGILANSVVTKTGKAVDKTLIYVIHDITAESEKADAETPKADAPTAAAATTSRKSDAVSDIEILVRNDIPVVEGSDFARTVKGQDSSSGAQIILFDMKNNVQAQSKLASITGKHIGWRMGVVLDGKMQSAPYIQNELRVGGQITGYRGVAERDEVLAVLQSGTLEAALNLMSEGYIGPELGKDNIQRGLTASLVALICVVVFMASYYLLAGVIADLAMLANLLILVMIMYWMRGSWTLPGIAGLILTVGMSVDANVLVFERIREELRRGSSMRLAVRNGYSRATPAIIDGNLTTFFSAVILAWVGSPEVQGFAIVLIIGLAASMFTALLFTRSLFELLIQAGLLRKLRMLRLFKAPNIPFSRIMRGAFWVSLVLVVGGLALAISAGDSSFAMEFNGGTQVEINYKQPQSIEDVRVKVAKLDTGTIVSFRPPEPVGNLLAIDKTLRAAGDPLATALVSQGAPPNSQGEYGTIDVQVFVDDIQAATEAVKKVFPEATDLTAQRATEFGFGFASALVQPITYTDETDKDSGRRYMIQVLSTRDDKVKQNLEGLFRDVIKRGDEISITLSGRELTVEDVYKMQGGAGGSVETPESAAPETDDGDDIERVVTKTILPDWRRFVSAYRADIELAGGTASQADLSKRIAEHIDERNVEKKGIKWSIEGKDTDPADPRKFKSFVFYAFDPQMQKRGVDEQQSRHAQREWDAIVKRAIEDPLPLSSSKVDKRIGDESKQQAIIAIILSLGIIVAYIWFRFARISYGFAAVVALVHDVSIALGLVVLFSWIGKSVPFIGEMKINLPMIGAFLTLVGYSLNDTIVVFDRIRENRGKFGELSEAVVNSSINQTLARTVLTSLTTWVVVMIMYVFGGVQSSIHGFAFVLSVGVIVGTYSSICIASPLLLWMRKKKRPGGGPMRA